MPKRRLSDMISYYVAVLLLLACIFASSVKGILEYSAHYIIKNNVAGDQDPKHLMLNNVTTTSPVPYVTTISSSEPATPAPGKATSGMHKFMLR